MYTLHIECVTGRCNHGRWQLTNEQGQWVASHADALFSHSHHYMHAYSLLLSCVILLWNMLTLPYTLSPAQVGKNFVNELLQTKTALSISWTFWLIATASIVFIDAINMRSSFTRNYLDRSVTLPIRAGRGWVTRCSSVACALIPSALITRALTSAAVE